MSEQTTQHPTFTTPDETRPFANGRLELLHVGGASEYAK
jgi:hypothetical protein